MRIFLILFLCCAGPFFTGLSLAASDADAQQELNTASELRKNKSFEKAADAYMGAVLYADTPALKANGLLSASLCYRAAKLYAKEFDCIERLLKDYMAHIDFKRAVDRQFEIADDYFNGHRDTAVSWLPFIKEGDRTVEFYETVLTHAACAAQAPNAKLRLAGLYLEKKPDKAIALFKEILSMHPETEAARFAFVELISVYVQLARRGDGDGAWTRLAIASLKDFLEAYPDDPKVPWAKKALEEVNAIDAKRMHGLAKYYHRSGRDDLAERYLARVIRDHGATENSRASERLLAEIDKTYVPPRPDAPRKEKYVHKFERNSIPLERNPIMIAPENSDNKWLFPIRNLRPDIHLDSRELPPERNLNNDEF